MFSGLNINVQSGAKIGKIPGISQDSFAVAEKSRIFAVANGKRDEGE